MKDWFKLYGIIALILFGLIVLAAGTGVLSGAISYVLAPFRGAVDAQIQIESGANRRYTYDHFHNMCAAIKAIEIKIDTQNALLNQNTSEDQRNMILTNIAGLQAQRANKITEYNADSDKAYTAARFKDDRLPRSLPLAAYDGNNKTSC